MRCNCNLSTCPNCNPKYYEIYPHYKDYTYRNITNKKSVVDVENVDVKTENEIISNSDINTQISVFDCNGSCISTTNVCSNVGDMFFRF